MFRNVLEVSGVQPDATMAEVQTIIETEAAGNFYYDKIWFDETDGSWDNFRQSANIEDFGLQIYSNLGKEEFTATAAQTVFDLTSFTYSPGDRELSVYVDGALATNYTETDSDTITFDSPLVEDDVVTVVKGEMRLLILNAKKNLRLLYLKNN